MAKNITKVYLLNTPLENDYKHTLYFESREAQQSYFAGQTVHSFTDFSYQRKDNIIRVPKYIDELWNCNYVMYQNTAYNNKWFYAFITDMKYVNDERTDITIETDVMQTWYYDFTSKPCFVEREHVADDTIGAHTVPENLETGEYVCQSHFPYGELNSLSIILATTKRIEAGNTVSVQGQKYDGIYSGCLYVVYSNNAAGIELLNRDLKLLDEDGAGESVNAIFLYPTALIRGLESGSTGGEFKTTDTPATKTITYNKLKTIKGYSNIKNNKLLTYPYTYMLVSNNAGGSAIYHQELFGYDTIEFRVEGCITPGGSIKLVPKEYKGVFANYEESINGGKFPICSWNTDAYTNWLTQNSVNLTVEGVGATASIIGGALSLAFGSKMVGAGMIAGGISQVANSVSSVYQHSLIPPQAKGNLNSGDVTTSSGMNTFVTYFMGLRPENAKIIDNYFTMFGYKVNRVKMRNWNHRSRYWYTKCIDYDCDGPIPQKDLQKIKDCYNNGITFWRKAEYMFDYDSPNTITAFKEGD